MKIEDLSKVLVIEIFGDKFELDITTLSVDDFLRIEALKQILSRNEYYKLATTWLSSAANAANIIDMISILRVMQPDIEKGLPRQVNSFENLNFFDIQQLLIIYVKQVAPWFNGWMKFFNEPFEEEAGGKDADVSNEK